MAEIPFEEMIQNLRNLASQPEAGLVVDTGGEGEDDFHLNDLVDSASEVVEVDDAGENDLVLSEAIKNSVEVFEQVDLGVRPKLEDVKGRLLEITNNDTTERRRKAISILLEDEGVAFNENINDVGEAGVVARLELETALKAVEDDEFGEDKHWNTKEGAIKFLEEECHIQVTEAVDIEEENFYERTEILISSNEMGYLNLLMRDFSPEVFLTPSGMVNIRNLDMCEDLLTESGNRDYWDEYNEITGPSDEEMFKKVQEIYLNHILGEVSTQRMSEASNTILEYENKINTIESYKTEDHKRALNTRRSSNRSSLVSIIKTISGPRPGGRNWDVGSDIDVANYLNKKFNFVENYDGSESGVIMRVLKKDYASLDRIGGNLDVAISREPKSELLRQLVKIHDLAVIFENTNFKNIEDSDFQRITTGIDEALINMLSLKKGDTLIVPSVVSVYDRVMRSSYARYGTAIDIDDPLILSEVKTKLADFFETPEEASLYIKMGRDVCRLTGVDAQYGFPRDVIKDVKGLSSTVRGTFLRGLLNFKKDLVSKGVDSRLIAEINVGVVPFWNKMRDIKNTESELIDVVGIKSLVENKLNSKTEFQNWLNSLKGAADAKKAESDFMSNPSLEAFTTKLMPGYGFLAGSPDKGRGYFLKRLGSYLQYKKAFSDNGYKLSEELNTFYITKEGTFKENDLFSSQDELNSFLRFYGLTTRPLNPLVSPLHDARVGISSLFGKHGEVNQKAEIKKDLSAVAEGVWDILKAFGKWGK